MATSPNYGWLEPDNTDLVKNGALAIRTLGNAIDTTMATMTPKSIVDAKGDLIAATANDTPARLAVGNNGEQIVADSSTPTGLRYQGSQAAGKNILINGGFDIWQRGTSSATQGAYTTADRWWMNAASTTFSRESTVVPAGVQYALKAVTSGTTTVQFRQAIETLNAIQFAGKTVVLSGEYQASTTTTIQTKLFHSSSVDVAVAGSWTEITPTSGGSVSAVNGSYTKSSSVFAVPSTAKSLMVLFDTGSVASAVSLYYGKIQLELGSVATEFERAGGTIQGELAACQRYFQKTNNQSEAPGAAPTSTPINAINASTTLVVGVPPFKGVMRVAPTVTLYSSVTGTTGRIRSGGADVVASAADVGEYAIGYISATGLVAGSNSTIAFAASAEL